MIGLVNVALSFGRRYFGTTVTDGPMTAHNPDIKESQHV